ncbi:hypothetical protein JC221_170 [Yersinia phage JC221]|nr:hypothetical protein JC221_170 [Yersinia phage JC221]
MYCILHRPEGLSDYGNTTIGKHALALIYLIYAAFPHCFGNTNQPRTKVNVITSALGYP